MSLDEDDEAFNDEFNRVIDDKYILHVDDEVYHHSHITKDSDDYTGIQVGLPRGS